MVQLIQRVNGRQVPKVQLPDFPDNVVVLYRVKQGHLGQVHLV